VDALKNSKLNSPEITKQVMDSMSVSELEAFIKSNLKLMMENYFRADGVKETYK
jgi:hypothetical protein